MTIRDEEAELQAGNTTRFPGPKPTEQPVAPETAKTPTKRLEEEYGGAIGEMGTNYIILKPEQMDDDTVMEVLEKSPAYNRDRRVVEDLKKGMAATTRPAAQGGSAPHGNQIVF